MDNGESVVSKLHVGIDFEHTIEQTTQTAFP